MQYNVIRATQCHLLNTLVIPAKQSVRECPESVIPAQAGIQKLIFISKLQYTIYHIRLTFFYCRTHWKAGIQMFILLFHL